MRLVVLKQDKDRFEPTDQQVTSYGVYLGLSFPQDEKYKPILYEALKAPLPQQWQACQNLDEQDSLVFRNKITQEVQENHPLDNYYQEKIMKLKGLTHNIETIAQQRQSWMKDSSSLFKKSKESAEEEHEGQEGHEENQNFMSEIEEERSFYMQQQEGKQERREIVISRPSRTPRTYIKKKRQADRLSQIRQDMLNYVSIPKITVMDIKLKQYPQFKSLKEIQKLNQLIDLNEQLEAKKAELANLEAERRSRIAYLQSLRNQIKILHI